MASGPFQFLLTIVVVAIVAGFVYDYFVRRMKHAEEARGHADAAEKAELLRRLEELEERVRVLERIVTDEPSNLRDRFSGL